MELKCHRCGETFDAAEFRGYCVKCITHFRDVRVQVSQAQHPAPGMYLDGTFTDEPCPQSVVNPYTEEPVCGLCGSDDLMPGYGTGTGYGMGSYQFCLDCVTFLDFHPDQE